MEVWDWCSYPDAGNPERGKGLQQPSSANVLIKLHHVNIILMCAVKLMIILCSILLTCGISRLDCM